jgi:translation initiation factor 2 gamma subunit (eIF-2gamma)
MRLQSIHPDDVIHVSIKGRQFYALVTSVEDGHVNFKPICPGAGWRSATAREVTAHWRRSGTRRTTSTEADV